MKSGLTAQPVFHLIVEITDEDARHDINDIMLPSWRSRGISLNSICFKSSLKWRFEAYTIHP